jgi:hypothetical protein
VTEWICVVFFIRVNVTKDNKDRKAEKTVRKERKKRRERLTGRSTRGRSKKNIC